MKRLITIALAILPLLAFGLPADAHGHYGRHGYGFHRHAHYRSHHRGHFRPHHHGRYRAFHHRHGRHHGAWGSRAHFAHDRSQSIPEERRAVYGMVTRSAIEHGLPPALAHGIVRAESGYNCHAYNRGAAGIMQIKPATARSVGISGGLQSCGTGLEAGMRYLQQAYALAHGNAAYAATLYNQGLGARPRRSGYSRTVMRMSSLR